VDAVDAVADWYVWLHERSLEVALANKPGQRARWDGSEILARPECKWEPECRCGVPFFHRWSALYVVGGHRDRALVDAVENSDSPNVIMTAW